MSQPAPLSPPTAPSAPAAAEIDLLAPLSPPALLKVALLCVLGGALGFGAGKAFIHHAQAQAVIRVATVARLGPVMPLTEVKARAESFGGVLAAMKQLHVDQPERTALAYKVTATPDVSHDGSVVELTFEGPDAATVEALAQARVAELVSETHAAYVAAESSSAARLAQAAAVADSMKSAAATATEAAAFEHWAGELSEARARAEREVVLSRDSEIIDAPHQMYSNMRVLMIAALGCFAGLLLGLVLTARPARGS